MGKLSIKQNKSLARSQVGLGPSTAKSPKPEKCYSWSSFPLYSPAPSSLAWKGPGLQQVAFPGLGSWFRMVNRGHGHLWEENRVKPGPWNPVGRMLPAQVLVRAVRLLKELLAPGQRAT